MHNVVHSTCLVAEDFDLADAKSENVRFVFTIDLPFRLRLGPRLTQSLEVQGRKVNVHLRNEIAVPEGTETMEALRLTKNIPDLFTRAAVEIVNPKIAEDDLKTLCESDGDAEAVNYPRASGEMFWAMEAINKIILAYYTATNQLFGGPQLRVFRMSDFLTCHDFQITCVGPPEALTEDDLDTIFSLKPDRQISAVHSVTGNLDDLPVEEVSRIADALSAQVDFIFYEHAFEAKTRMIAQDYVGALLMAVAALEGAHAVVVGDALRTRLPDDSKFNLPKDYIKELGMTLCNQITPYLFLDESDRPSAEMIKGAKLGITYRNEIMHASRNKRGDYLMRLRSNKDLCDGYSAVLQVYTCYRKVIESQRNGAQQDEGGQ